MTDSPVLDEAFALVERLSRVEKVRLIERLVATLKQDLTRPDQSSSHREGASLADFDFQRLVTRCRELPPASGNYLVHNYVENLFITVLDFQLHVTIVDRALAYYQRHVQWEIPDFQTLKALLAKYPDNQEGNLQIAKYLWNYSYWNRVEMLRRLVDYFDAQGVTTQEQLKQWAAQADFERDFKGKIRGASFSIFQWLVMRQGVETVKPDMWIHRFIQDVLGHSVSDATAVELLKRAARELGVKAYELDWRIWEYQRGGR